MRRPKIHARRKLTWCPDEDNNWTLCQRHVEKDQIAASEDGVTCLSCLVVIDFDKQTEMWEKEFRDRHQS